MDGEALARFGKGGLGDTGGGSMVDPRMGSNIWPLLAGLAIGVEGHRMVLAAEALCWG
jgi:hypothetical protein